MEYETVGGIDGHFGGGVMRPAETAEDVLRLVLVFLGDARGGVGGGVGDEWETVGCSCYEG